jgi:iron complex transport system substrate-binding protein
MCLLFSNCTNISHKIQHDEESYAIDTTRINIKYAEGFSVNYLDNETCLIDIKDPQSTSEVAYKFALVKKGKAKSLPIPNEYQRIDYPINSVICMTSLQLSNFIKLDETEKVVGISSARHLFNNDIKSQIKQGHTVKIGIEGNFNSELIMGINPDIILISPYKRGGYEVLKDVNIPLVPHLGYKERSPLAQAEWIKLVALLLGKTEKANNIFTTIENKYNELKNKVANVAYRPVVLSGESRGENWYAPGGKSFLAQLFNDSGACYFLTEDNDTGGKNIDFETVYSKAANAQFWRIVNSYKGKFTYETLAEEDHRYEDFFAFKQKRIIYCNMSEKPFYESMPTEPEVVLADFIHIFHPYLLESYTPVYYSLLK